MTDTQTGMRTIKQMIDEKFYPGGEGGLRRLIEDDKDGFAKACVRRVGRRVFILLSAYHSYIDRINGIGEEA